MSINNNNSAEKKDDQPTSVPQEKMKFRRDTGDIRSGAKQVDQIERLKPGNDAKRKSRSKQSGSPPNTIVNDGSRETPDSKPKGTDMWPENINPAK